MMLSIGALKKIHQGIEEDDHILQVLGHKAIPGSDPPRYRLHLSDGQFSTSNTILATNLNYLISDNLYSPGRQDGVQQSEYPAQQVGHHLAGSKGSHTWGKSERQVWKSCAAGV